MTELKFLTIFVPQQKWFQKFLAQLSRDLRAKDQSLSQHLLRLILQDLIARGEIPPEQARAYLEQPATRPRKAASRHVRFCLSLPLELRSWLPAVLARVAPRPKLSQYVWGLLIREHSEAFGLAELQEWEAYRPGRGTQDRSVGSK